MKTTLAIIIFTCCLLAYLLWATMTEAVGMKAHVEPNPCNKCLELCR